MKKKITALCLIVCLLAVAVIGGTLAYFTDTEEATNTFTIGEVDIVLLESTLHRVVDDADNAEIEADAANYQTYLTENGRNMVPGEYVRKAPYIKNVGTQDAYVRTRLLIPEAAFLGDSQIIDIMTTTTAVNDGSITDPTRVGVVTKDDGVNYVEFAFTYNEALPAAANAEDAEDVMTYWPAFWQVRLYPEVTQEQVAALIDAKVLTEDGQFNIFVEADAIQAAGFDTAAEAFAAYTAPTGELTTDQK